MDDMIIRITVAKLRGLADALENLLPHSSTPIFETGRKWATEMYYEQLKSLGLTSTKAARRLHEALRCYIGNYGEGELNSYQRYKLHHILYSDPNEWRSADIRMLEGVGNKTTREILEEMAPINFSKII